MSPNTNLSGTRKGFYKVLWHFMSHISQKLISFSQPVREPITLQMKLKRRKSQTQFSPRAVATSPSCQARQWKAVGAMPTGKLISVPCTVVRVSLTDTSRRIRGLRRILSVEYRRTGKQWPMVQEGEGIHLDKSGQSQLIKCNVAIC